MEHAHPEELEYSYIADRLDTGNFTLLISRGYRIFRFIECDRLLDYL